MEQLLSYNYSTRRFGSLGTGVSRSTYHNTLLDLCLLPIVGYMIFYTFMRPLGAAGLGIPVLFVLIVFFATRQFLSVRRYALLMLWSILILALSLTDFMPKSWTRYYANIAAFRQFLPLVMLPFLVSAFYVLFVRWRLWIQKHALKILLLLYVIHLMNPLFSDKSDEFYGTLYTFTNSTVPIWITFILWAFRPETRTYVAMIGFAVILFLASSAQTKLFALMLPLIWIFPYRRLLLWGLAVSMLLFLVIAPLYSFELYQLDTNAGVRAVMWFDVWRLLVDTKGFGVGFGTEYITNQFDAIFRNNWGIGTFNENFFYVGTHSTVYDMLLRVGFIGLAIFLYWLLPLLFSAKHMLSDREGAMFTSVAAIFLISNTINVGIYSINFLFGGAMMLAFLDALRHTQRQQYLHVHS